MLWPADIFPIDLALVPKWSLISDAHYFIERLSRNLSVGE